jgi:hypothetical protein
LGYFLASADSSFIPVNTKVEFDRRANFSNQNFYTAAITPGYAHTLVLRRHLFISAGVSGLIGLQYHEGLGNGIYDSGFNYFLKGLGKAAAGYHGTLWVFGATLTTDIQGLNTRFVQYRTNNLDVSVFVAYRFKSKWKAGQRSLFQKKKK